ncbi:hypothetical protein C464_09974 [Halorubrum coriense DSM 10284]|uniref:Uncharacterized protein n=1 Tax=Halorubrum coriense DSM 10284 TaxID=1227466 RepID=M0EGS8_9EURY|nr:hypothetical protein C464_09974 [Halorubrum coriense DSM 10284]
MSTPDADETDAYCSSLIFDHDPTCVRDCEENRGSPAYSRYDARLATHIDERDLTAGNAREWSPGE